LAKQKVFLSPTFSRKLKKLTKQEKVSLDEAVRFLIENPESGQQKKGDLLGVRVYKSKINKQLTLLSYELVSDSIHLLTFGSHENFYRDIKRDR
jgi:mRNA-degrading endonuclease RelE of RelBE toxin-antitoxin system